VPEVLSVCSVQFKAVCDGIRSKSHNVTIEGDDVHLDWSAGAFITMNPGAWCVHCGGGLSDWRTRRSAAHSPQATWAAPSCPRA